MTLNFTMIPGPTTSLLLQSALLSDEIVKDSWERYLYKIGDLRSYLKKNHGIKGILPLLYYSLQKSGVSLDKNTNTLLKTAYLSEHTRYEYYLKVCDEIFTCLFNHSLPFLVVKGMAASHLAYPKPTTRHCHDLDIFLNKENIADAANSLHILGLLEKPDIRRPRLDLLFIHPSGFPIELHNKLFYLNYYSICEKEIWGNQESIIMGNHCLQTTSPEMTIIHTCVHASYCRSSLSLRWICDVYFLIKTCKPRWDKIIELVVDSHSALPLLHVFRYMADELHVPIPRKIIITLQEQAARASQGQKQIWVFSQRYGSLRHSLYYLYIFKETRSVIAASIFPSKEYIAYLSDKSSTNKYIYKGYYLCKFLCYVILIFLPIRLFLLIKNSVFKPLLQKIHVSTHTPLYL